MLARTPLRDLAIAWLKEQDAHTLYDWTDPNTCVCAQLARDLDRWEDWRAYRTSNALFDAIDPEYDEWAWLDTVAVGDATFGDDGGEWTFGAFLDRLQKVERYPTLTLEEG